MPDHRPDPQLRWHTEPATRSPIFVVPGDSSGSGTLKPMGKTWGMRVSGDVDKLVPHGYRCPVHGVFEQRVPASAAPDDALCPMKTILRWRDGDKFHERGDVCGQRSPWAGSSCAIGIEPGMVTG